MSARALEVIESVLFYQIWSHPGGQWQSFEDRIPLSKHYSFLKERVNGIDTIWEAGFTEFARITKDCDKVAIWVHNEEQHKKVSSDFVWIWCPFAYQK